VQVFPGMYVKHSACLLLLKDISLSKVSWPNSVTQINYQSILEWCVVRCGSKNRHQKRQLKEIGLCAQNLLAILSSIVNTNVEMYMTTPGERESSL
jgi:hypothetical protein